MHHMCVDPLILTDMTDYFCSRFKFFLENWIYVACLC